MKYIIIHFKYEEIGKIKKKPLKTIVTKQVVEVSYKYLMSKIKSKSKESNYKKKSLSVNNIES